MGYLPIFMDLRGRDCLVVGGGAFAASRIDALVEAEAVVTLIAPEITPRLAALAEAGAIHYCARGYISSDMRGRFMAWVSAADAAIARTVANDARAMRVLINAGDRPELCDFITPAVVKRGEVQIAIGTGGASPALARRLRERLESIVGPEYGPLAEISRHARKWLRSRVEDPEERARLLSSLIDGELPDAIRRDDREEVERLLQAHLGAGFDGRGLGTQSGQVGESALPSLPAPSLRASTLRRP
jgi:siroheme synthase-like protein